MLLLLPIVAVAQGPEPKSNFTPFEMWKTAVKTNDAPKLKLMYSNDPQVVVKTAQGETKGPEQELVFWPANPNSGRQGIDFELGKTETLPDGTEHIQFQTEFRVRFENGVRSWFVRGEQFWQKMKDGSWRIVATKRSTVYRLRQPMNLDGVIYQQNANAMEDISAAVSQASNSHKRILLDFGGNWCHDCHVLDLAFQLPEIEPVVKANYIVVHVDVGEYTKNLDLAEKYRIPLKSGVPAMAVLDSNGKLLFSQENKEFENARSLAPEDILAFLNKWKPQTSKQ